MKKQRKEPVQLELFVPHEEGYEFKVIVTNKQGKAKGILLFHNGRASQENVFSELKDQCQMDYVPVRRLAGNQWYFLSAVIEPPQQSGLLYGAFGKQRQFVRNLSIGQVG